MLFYLLFTFRKPVIYRACPAIVVKDYPILRENGGEEVSDLVSIYPSNYQINPDTKLQAPKLLNSSIDRYRDRQKE